MLEHAPTKSTRDQKRGHQRLCLAGQRRHHALDASDVQQQYVESVGMIDGVRIHVPIGPLGDDQGGRTTRDGVGNESAVSKDSQNSVFLE
jgi:hypothetical protein